MSYSYPYQDMKTEYLLLHRFQHARCCCFWPRHDTKMVILLTVLSLLDFGAVTTQRYKEGGIIFPKRFKPARWLTSVCYQGTRSGALLFSKPAEAFQIVVSLPQ